MTSFVHLFPPIFHDGVLECGGMCADDGKYVSVYTKYMHNVDSSLGCWLVDLITGSSKKRQTRRHLLSPVMNLA